MFRFKIKTLVIKNFAIIASLVFMALPWMDRVYAEVVEKGFEKVFIGCPAGYEQITGRDTDGNPIIKAGDTTSNFLATERWFDLCVNLSGTSGVNRLKDDPTNDNINYCPANMDFTGGNGAADGNKATSVGYWGEEGKTGYVGQDDTGAGPWGECCPDTHPYFYDNWLNVGSCCEIAGIETGVGASNRCQGRSFYQSNEPEVIQVNLDSREDPGAPFAWGDVGWKCESNGLPGCITHGGLWVPNDTINNPAPGAFIISAKCYETGSEIPVAPGKVCNIDGTLVDKDEFERFGGEALVTCEKLDAINEREACRACFDRNEAGKPQVFIYTSLGCIDTSRDGIVTRMMQIGVGIIGGLMVYRIIKAALLYQNRDPSSQQEARENSSAAIWALVMLLGSIVILRFLGINVLSIVPISFFR